jgi:hypothetical protein
MAKDPLRVRLFGYGVPYRVRFDAAGTVQPVDTDATQEATDLARQLRALIGEAPLQAIDSQDTWAASVPFGRCGVEGLPHEHLVVHFASEAYLDVLTEEGFSEHPVAAGEMIHVAPGMINRLRARPRPGHRVLVGFQTEDRTPLKGNAAPFTLDGEVPEGYAERLIKTHGAFAEVKKMALADPAASAAVLKDFFAAMAQRLAGNEEIAAIQAQAREQGTYAVEDEAALCQRQQALLRPQVLERIQRGDEHLFRFPGMFGGITTLFNAMTD